MDSGCNTKDDMFKSKVDPCWFSSLRVKDNTDWCIQYGKWICGRFAGVKRVTPKFSRKLPAENVKGILKR